MLNKCTLRRLSKGTDTNQNRERVDKSKRTVFMGEEKIMEKIFSYDKCS